MRFTSNRAALLLLSIALHSLTPASATPFQAVFEDISVDVTSAGSNVYRLSVSPRVATTTLRVPSKVCESDDGLTEIRLNEYWLEARIRSTTNANPVWRGRFSALPSYGHAHVPGTKLEWSARAGEAMYGLGQRFNGLDQAGEIVEMWIRDAPGQGDASYYCSPVLYSLPAEAGSDGYCLFAADNPDGEFSLNPLGEGLNRYLRAGQTWTIYLAIAPTLKELVQQRAHIQGPFRGVPDWAWGPWISRNSYESQREAEAAIKGMLKRDFPVSVIVQEAWKGAAKNGDFNNFSKDRWPDADGFLAQCRKLGIQNVLWQVPIVHPTTPDFAEAERRHFFVRKPDGSVSWRKEWLKGFANVDFTNPDAVHWWKDQMRDEIKHGVRGFKADDGEDIKPDDVFFDGRRGWQLHNEYSAMYARALTELFDEEKADGMLWCRSASLGCEHTPALWAGDQYATWPQYRSLLSAGLSAGLSGAPFWGHDIGGYIGNPTPELYIRWLQFGAFSPIMQYHGNKPREPWLFGPEVEEAYELLSRLRMNLRPTLKKLGEEAVRTGLPLMRPMVMEFPDDPRFRDEDTQYMFGPDLLVAPVLEEGAFGRRIKFPAGRWQHLLKPIAFDGPADLNIPIELVDAPVFVREGATLDVELPASAELGIWNTNAQPRTLTFDKSRPVISNIQFPLSGNTLSRHAAISFSARPDMAEALRAYSFRRNHPGNKTRLDITHDGDNARIELLYPGSREADFVVVIHDGKKNIFTGTVRWQSPVAIEAEPQGSRVVRDGVQKIQTRLVNRSDDALFLHISSQSKSGVTITVPERDISLQPRASWTGEWPVKCSAAQEIADVVVHFVVSSGDRKLAESDACFARALRMAVTGPFPAAEKEAYSTPFPPEWITTPDVNFRTSDGVVRWTSLSPEHQIENDGIDFEKLWGERDHAAGYVMAKVLSREERNVELRIGSDDTITAWLNGMKVFSKEVYRLAEWDQEVVPVRLAAGDNLLVFKVAQDRNPWRLQFHLTGPGGEPLAGVTDVFDAQAYRADRDVKGPIMETPQPVLWHIAGPFALERPENPSATGQFDLLARSPDPLSAVRLSWQTASGLVDFNQIFGEQRDMDAYATASWTVDKPTPIEIHCGSDDGIVIWLNGKRIYSAQKQREFKRDEDTVRATLRPGRNVVFCRIRQSESEWKFQADVWDVSQWPIRPLPPDSL